MATLIVVWCSNGVISRCDERCYNAKRRTPCTCCCGGINHAAGLAKAFDNTGPALERATKFAADQSNVLGAEVYIAGQIGLLMGATE